MVSGDESDSSLQARTQLFLQDFFVKGQELVRELIEENDRLRHRLSTLGEDPGVSALSNDETQVLVTRLRAQIERLEAECEEIRRLAGSVEAESGGFRQRLESLEQEHYHLAAMYVAGRQFQASSTLDEVLRTITEVLLNFVGVGRFTLYCVDEERQVLFPLHREGGDIDECPELSLPAEGPLGQAIAHGPPWTRKAPRGDDGAAILQLPLFSGTRLVGVARIEGFLPQKSSFEEADFALLEIVSEHSGVSIESAWVRAHASELPPFARPSLEELVVA